MSSGTKPLLAKLLTPLKLNIVHQRGLGLGLQDGYILSERLHF